MKKDWPHLDILADKTALLGTDSRLKLIEAVLFDFRRRIDEVNDYVASTGERLNLVEETLAQQSQTGQKSLQLRAQGKSRFPSPPADDDDELHENVANLRRSVEKECMKREQEIISVQRQLDGFRDSYKRLCEWQGIQQSALDNCYQRLENCEDTRASIQMLTSAKSEMRERLEEVQRSVETCLATQQALSKDQITPADVSAHNGPKPAAGVNPFLTGRAAKLSREISGVTERLTSLELCMQGSALERSASDNAAVHEVRRMQLAIATLSKSVSSMQHAIATVSRSVSKVTKDVFDMRASEVTSRSSTAMSLGSILTQGSMLGKRPDIPHLHASSAGGTVQLIQKSPPQTSPHAPSCVRSPGIRSLGRNSDLATGKEDIASDASASTQTPPPLQSRKSNTQSTSLKFATPRAGPSVAPKESRSATLGAKTTARSALTEPVHDRFSTASTSFETKTVYKLVQRDQPGLVR